MRLSRAVPGVAVNHEKECRFHTVIIVGAPVACKEGIKDTWRDLSKWVAGQLFSRYGDQVTVRYFDLFDPDCPSLPPDSQLPIVLVDGVTISSGGKLSIPLIRQNIEELKRVS